MFKLIITILTTLLPVTDAPSRPAPTPAMEPCGPGICCENCRLMTNGTTWCNGCSQGFDAASCNGSFLSCGSECYTGDDQCHSGPSFNECCG